MYEVGVGQSFGDQSMRDQGTGRGRGRGVENIIV